MMFNFFSDLKKGEYSFKDFKSFCDKIKVTFKMRHQKKIVIKAIKRNTLLTLFISL